MLRRRSAVPETEVFDLQVGAFRLHISTQGESLYDIVDRTLSTLHERILATLGLHECADGSLVHDFEGQPTCPKCGFEGIKTDA